MQIGPRCRPVQQQTLGQGHGLRSSRDRLHSISGSRLQRHFLLEAILLRSCLNHPPLTLQPSWHQQDSRASGHRYLRLREGPGMALEECVRPRGATPPQLCLRWYRLRARPPTPLQADLQLCPPARVGRAEALGSCCSWRRQAWHPAWKDRGQPPAPPAQVQAPEAQLRGEGRGCWQALAKAKVKSS